MCLDQIPPALKQPHANEGSSAKTCCLRLEPRLLPYGQEHGAVGVSDEDEGGEVDAEEDEGGVFPSVLARLVKEERDADGVVAVEQCAKVGQSQHGQHGDSQAGAPDDEHDQVSVTNGATSHLQWVQNADVPDRTQGFICE